VAGAPYPKASQLARGERRYRRKVASPKQWQAIIEAKRGPCRLERFICEGRIEYHHIVPRSQGGDDVEDNIAPLCTYHHANLWMPSPRRAFAELLTDAEYAYVVGKLGESGMERLFGVGRT